MGAFLEARSGISAAVLRNVMQIRLLDFALS
jgi:hypothetical protein